MNSSAISDRSAAIAIQRRLQDLLKEVGALKNPVVKIGESARQLKPEIQPNQEIEQILVAIQNLESLLETTIVNIHPESLAAEPERHATIWSVKTHKHSICIRTANHTEGPFSLFKLLPSCSLTGDIYQLLRKTELDPHILTHGSEAEIPIANAEQIPFLKWEIAKILETHGWTAIVLGESTITHKLPLIAEPPLIQP